MFFVIITCLKNGAFSIIVRLGWEPKWTDWYPSCHWEGGDENNVGKVSIKTHNLKWCQQIKISVELNQAEHGGGLHPSRHLHQLDGRRGLENCGQPYQSHTGQLTPNQNKNQQISSFLTLDLKFSRFTTAQVDRPTLSHGVNFSPLASNPLSKF